MNDRSTTRVLMLVENDSYPDDTRIVLESETLRDAGHAVTVICPTGIYRRFHETLGGVQVYRYPKPREPGGFVGYLWEYGYSLAVTWLIALYVSLRHGFDVIHARTPPDMFVLVAGFFKLFGKRYVVDLHDMPVELYQAKHNGDGNRFVVAGLAWFERLACRLADCHITTNETQRRLRIERGGVPADRCHVVRNAPAPEFLEPVEPLASLRDHGQTVIGYMGILNVQDRGDFLLRTLHHLKNDLGRDDFRAVIVGNGTAIDDLKLLTGELGLAAHVRFVGFQVGDDLLRHVASFDIGVTPDPSNPYNDSCTMLKVMEYMALAKPVVAFDLPENRVTAGAAALYAQMNDELQFARCIATLMDSPDERAALGRIGRQRVETLLSWQQQRENLLEAYRCLLAPAVGGEHESAAASSAAASSAARSPLRSNNPAGYEVTV
jgi:glycosyltransferase involved in cell wall biosynthesis